MPKTVSRAQNRFMQMCAHRRVDGCPEGDVAERFNASVHGTHKVRHMPQHVRDGKPVRGRFPERLKTKVRKSAAHRLTTGG